eukprot:scaffold297489_cov28-Prasinocladus_malaysianus.AAC.1
MLPDIPARVIASQWAPFGLLCSSLRTIAADDARLPGRVVAVFVLVVLPAGCQPREAELQGRDEDKFAELASCCRDLSSADESAASEEVLRLSRPAGRGDCAGRPTISLHAGQMVPGMGARWWTVRTLCLTRSSRLLRSASRARTSRFNCGGIDRFHAVKRGIAQETETAQ